MKHSHSLLITAEETMIHTQVALKVCFTSRKHAQQEL